MPDQIILPICMLGSQLNGKALMNCQLAGQERELPPTSAIQFQCGRNLPSASTGSSRSLRSSIPDLLVDQLAVKHHLIEPKFEGLLIRPKVAHRWIYELNLYRFRARPENWFAIQRPRENNVEFIFHSFRE